MSTIVSEEPFVAVVDGKFLKTVCSHCFKRSEETLQRCARCKVVSYCSISCQKKDWIIHKDECAFLVQVSPNTPRVEARMMGRLLIRKLRGETTSLKAAFGTGEHRRSFDDLMHHTEEIQSSNAHLQLFTSLAHGLQLYVDEEFMVEAPELLRIFGRMVINSFGITGDDQVTVGTGLYLGLSALDHSCAPDAFVRFQGRTAILRSPTEGKKFSNKLTIPYTNLDCLSSERQKTLEKQYFFKCTCKVCNNKERDGYARSLQCDTCCNGVCLVMESTNVLTCTRCGAVLPVPVDEAFRMNQEIEWHLEKKRDDNDDVHVSLKSDVALYKKYHTILSRFNLPLASLAYRIVNLALSVDRRDIAYEHATYYLPAYKYFVPAGHPLLTSCLITASVAASFADPPNVDVLKLLEEALESCMLSHGPHDPTCVEVVGQIECYRTRLQRAIDAL